MRFWAAFILLAPLLWLQGKYARWRTPSLEPVLANGQSSAPVVAAATAGHKQLLVLGESPAVGVGVNSSEEALTAQIATALSSLSADHWQWQVIGENGAKLTRLLELLAAPSAQAADCIVVVMGVNDCKGLTPRKQWRKQLTMLIECLRQQSTAPIIFTPVPPVHSFTALPQPLRWVLGQRAMQLNEDMQASLLELPAVYRAPSLPTLSAEQLAIDRFHPSASACVEWGQRTAAVIQAQLS